MRVSRLRITLAIVTTAVLLASTSTAMAVTGTVQGHITDTHTGTGISGISVTVWQRPGGTWAIAGSGTTNASGDYSIPSVNAAGSRVAFWDPSGRYAGKGWRYGYYYFDSRSETLTVVAGTVTANATMSPAAHVRMRLVTEATGGPIAGVMADAQDVSANVGIGSMTGSDGWATAHWRADLYRLYGFDNDTAFETNPPRPWTNSWGDCDVHLAENTTTTVTIPLRHLASVYHDVVRESGASRYDTAVQMAKESFPPDLWGSWKNVTDVIVASGEDAAIVDALSASGLAGAYDAPLLLVKRDSVPSVVSNALGVMPDGVKVHIVGGTGAVSASVAGDLGDIPTVGSVDRCAGATRYETAAMVARWMKTKLGGAFPTTALIANGADATKYWDALALSPIAYARHYPILLTARDSVPATTTAVMTALSLSTRYLAGGTAAVSDATRIALGVPSGNRLAGTSRYGTAVAIAQRAQSNAWLGYSQPGVAASIPDALAAGPMLGKKYSPLLLTGNGATTMNAETNALITSAPFEAAMQWGFVCGGTGPVPEAPRLAWMASQN